MGKTIGCEQGKGGRTTNSPPPKSGYKILSSGIDTLNLSIDVEWMGSSFFNDLSKAKDLAREEKKDVPFSIRLLQHNEEWHCVVKPNGAAGYEWLLSGKDFTFKIGAWKKPISRPSMMVEIRSETLWRMGFKAAVETVEMLIGSAGGKVVSVKPSRVDLCLDMLLPVSEWCPELIFDIVTRAEQSATYNNLKMKRLTGFDFGSGQVRARLYDKEFEIDRKSKKYWMYDIWGLKDVPDDYRIIRVEFQLRREVLKELGVNLICDLFEKTGGMWAYCSESWLSFRDNAGSHMDERKVLPWWLAIQNGFTEAQGAFPLVRVKACQVEEKQLVAQAYGLMSALGALQNATGETNDKSVFGTVLNFVQLTGVYGKDDKQFQTDVLAKRYKYQRLRDRLRDLFVIDSPAFSLIGQTGGAQFVGVTA